METDSRIDEWYLILRLILLNCSITEYLYIIFLYLLNNSFMHLQNVYKTRVYRKHDYDSDQY